MIPKKKSGLAPVVVFGVLCVVWGFEVFFFNESLTRAEEERDRLSAQAKEKTVEYAMLKREAEQLREYTHKMTSDPEFIALEARRRLGVAGEGEIVIRAEGD